MTEETNTRKHVPRDARIIHLILTSLGVEAYQQNVPLQLLTFAHRYIHQVLQDAQAYSDYARPEGSTELTVDDIRLAIASQMNNSFRGPPPKEFLLELASERNRKPLPPINPSYGLRLPPKKYLLTSPNWDLELPKAEKNEEMRILKHSIQRRNHRERAQPVERQKWGLLEKPKDYRLRALDYRSKQLRLKRLREKAAEKNPDEFYFGMMREKTRNGIVYVDRGNPVLSEETVRLLKTQDAAYIKTMQRIENETYFYYYFYKIKKLEEHIQINIQTSNCARKHYHFISEEEFYQEKYQEQENKDLSCKIRNLYTEKSPKSENQVESILDQTNNIQSSQKSIENISSANSKLIRELESRKARAAQLSILSKHIDLQRNLQTKGERKKVGVSQEGIPIYKWKLERKK
ncbi:hypothetical protein PORY_000999 [Pneumocystis oryctolagi]|uniref:Uncharacterized protein n=1 Tax=Pneumocystis oryctolagi TaxID=42067 RepID=A0ACB7CCZ0_9ASCO|nr:hypothetical protein PORY_000999 [Pneumocystis oryctolagi]